ncbi:transcriptional regulator with XRE-family HTH domain [Saccharothrix coeruleofusca]|nr:transcriptional regulator with XRE-family HTH domain [Saccharothrix coeruleofusca]
MSGDRSPAEYRAALAEQIRKLMRQKGVTRVDIRRALSCSESKAGKLVRGDTSISPVELTAILDLLGVSGEARADLQHLNEEGRRKRPPTDWGKAIPDRLRKFFNTEETARRIESYRPDLLHGLVQTERYARAVIQTNRTLLSDDVERLVRARLVR